MGRVSVKPIEISPKQPSSQKRAFSRNNVLFKILHYTLGCKHIAAVLYGDIVCSMSQVSVIVTPYRLCRFQTFQHAMSTSNYFGHHIFWSDTHMFDVRYSNNIISNLHYMEHSVKKTLISFFSPANYSEFKGFR